MQVFTVGVLSNLEEESTICYTWGKQKCLLNLGACLNTGKFVLKLLLETALNIGDCGIQVAFNPFHAG